MTQWYIDTLPKKRRREAIGVVLALSSSPLQLYSLGFVVSVFFDNPSLPG
jgi:hypothetical protein